MKILPFQQKLYENSFKKYENHMKILCYFEVQCPITKLFHFFYKTIKYEK